MTIEIFEALNIPQNAECCVIEPPQNFPNDFDFTDTPGSSFDSVLVFVTDPALFAEEVSEAVRVAKEDGLLYVLTPQAAKETFSMDFIKKECTPLGVTPGDQHDLNDEWTATLLEITK